MLGIPCDEKILMRILRGLTVLPVMVFELLTEKSHVMIMLYFITHY